MLSICLGENTTVLVQATKKSFFVIPGLDAGSIASLTGTLRGHNASGGGHHGTPATTAYTITINSQAASSMDESILPLTEDKTRF